MLSGKVILLTVFFILFLFPKIDVSEITYYVIFLRTGQCQVTGGIGQVGRTD